MAGYLTSGVGCFSGGVLGAVTFLFMTLLFDKEIDILDNGIFGRGAMAVIYVTLGGAVAIVVGVGTDFDPGQLRVAFASGLAWPAVAAGIGAGRQIGEVNRRREQAARLAREIESRAGAEKAEVADYYRKRLERAEEYMRTAIEQAQKQRDDMQAFYQRRIESLGGTP